MPELPEVETIRIGLQTLLPGSPVLSVDFDWPKSFPNAEADARQFLVGSRVVAVSRRAKVLIIGLDSGYSLVIHLKMTGQLVYVPGAAKNPSKERFGAGHPSDSLVGSLPDKSTRVTITFQDKAVLYFNDQRKFGWVRLLPSVEVPHIDFMKRFGPEPLEDTFTQKAFTTQLTRRARSRIKAALLDQTIIAGIGNIYADESLWAAKIHPETRVKDISPARLKVLRTAIIDVLSLSIAKGGSTNKNYVNAEGKKGSYMDFAHVYNRTGQPCDRCGNPIQKIRSAGRGTHICLTCQREPS
ncbi:MAG: bifunctional DNA-formamidopyrimidine glycosylase/DNA-(apurinic or apyrimidinic site) lyase [Candidatus Saccharibacteria bacterium]|nr:bifunctional DNA-formamidopyrimidine glycosylase/DNA-(apurinic or apyrimidinic site) lyase [Candidatus Saccharibacteria bacterium]